MTLKEFFLSLDPNTMAERYAGEYVSSLKLSEENAGVPEFELRARLSVALLAFLGEVKADTTEENPNRLVYTLESIDEDEDEGASTWYIAMVADTKGFRLDKNGYPKNEAMSLSPRDWPKALGYKLHNQCADPYAQACALAAGLKFPGFMAVEMEAEEG